jgi:hypothetical protein
MPKTFIVYKLFSKDRDGDGLALRIYPTGAKVWHYIYTNTEGKKRYQRLGEYPDLGLSEARQLRDDLRKQVFPQWYPRLSTQKFAPTA